MTYTREPDCTRELACAACRHQRRKCKPECIFRPYFPPESSRQFVNAHKLFGMKNISHILKQVEPEKQEYAMKSIIFEADARAIYPVGGACTFLLQLQREIKSHEEKLAVVNRQLTFYRSVRRSSLQVTAPAIHSHQILNRAAPARPNPQQRYGYHPLLQHPFLQLLADPSDHTAVNDAVASSWSGPSTGQG